MVGLSTLSNFASEAMTSMRPRRFIVHITKSDKSYTSTCLEFQIALLNLKNFLFLFNHSPIEWKVKLPIWLPRCITCMINTKRENSN